VPFSLESLFDSDPNSTFISQLPSAYVNNSSLINLFNDLCVGYQEDMDFNDLPIPFACVATDIIKYEEYDFHSGRLPQAMRASMAIPAVFSPVRIDSCVLVDGGMRNNFPVDIARKMGADIVIGISVHDHPMTVDDVWGTMSVLSQIVDANTKNKFEENKAATDVFMYVDPDGYGAASFSAAAIDTLIRRGEEEAMRHWDELIALKKRIGISNNFRPKLLHPLSPEVMTDKHRVLDFEFVNMTQQDERFLRQKFHFAKMDSIYAAKEQEIATSMRMDLFYQSAECRLIPKDSGCVVRMVAGSRKTTRMYAGFRYDTEEYAAIQMGLSVPLKTTIPVNTDITLRLGKRNMLRGELTVHPRSFTRPTLSYTFRRNDIDIYVDGERDYSILYKHHQADIVPLNLDVRHFNMQFGLRWDYLHYKDKLAAKESTDITLENDHFFSYRAQILFNSEDHWIFPSRGARFKAEYAYLTNNFARIAETTDEGETVRKPGLSQLSANWRMSFTTPWNLTIQPMFYGRMLFGTIIPLAFSNVIGGQWFGHYLEQQMPFPGVGYVEHVDNKFVAAQLKLQQRIGTNHYVLLRTAAAQESHHLKELFDHKTHWGSTIGYYYNTMFGPLGVAMGYSNKTRDFYMYVNLGYEF
jgi:NTE family protein